MPAKAKATPEQVEAGKQLLESYDLDDSPTPVSAATAVAEPSIETTAEPVATKPVIPAWVQRLARSAGITETETADMSVDDIKEAVALKSAIGRDIESTRGQHRELNAAGRPYDPATGKLLPVNKPTQEAVSEAAFDPKELGVDLSEADEFTQGILTKLSKSLFDRNKSLEARIAHLEQLNHHRATKDAGDKLDQLFDSNQSVFGKGNRDKLDPNSDEFKRRKMVIALMKSNYESDKSLPFEENFEMASKAFTSLIPAAKTPEPVEEVQDPHGYKNGVTRAPTNRNAPTPKRSDKAAEDALARRSEIVKMVTSPEEDDLPEGIV